MAYENNGKLSPLPQIFDHNPAEEKEPLTETLKTVQKDPEVDLLGKKLSEKDEELKILTEKCVNLEKKLEQVTMMVFENYSFPLQISR